MLLIGIAIFVISIVAFFAYFLLTNSEKEILVRRKCIQQINNREYFILYDENNDKFVFSTMFWLNYFDQKNIYNWLQTGHKYKITSYGIRINFFDLYPSITFIKK